MLSQTEENYLKALFRLTYEAGELEAGTNDIAITLDVKPATVNSMLKKLKEKQFVDFEKYGKIALTEAGKRHALKIVRKHRLWETFLCEKLDFSWDEVHEVAEQLEHIQSQKLIDQIDKFLGYPEKDPHGEPIPSRYGEITLQKHGTLLSVPVGKVCTMVGVKDDSPTFLQYINKVGLSIDQQLKVTDRQSFDNLIEIEVNESRHTVSEKFADTIYVDGV